MLTAGQLYMTDSLLFEQPVKAEDRMHLSFQKEIMTQRQSTH